MRQHLAGGFGIAVSLLIMSCLCLRVRAEASPRVKSSGSGSATEVLHAKGTFVSKMGQLAPYNAGDPHLGRLSLDKVYDGGLAAAGKGEMLSAGTDVAGSAGYVAMERVKGVLAGRPGTFVLMHVGTLSRGVSRLTISVVPDSGTGELVGIFGKMAVTISGGEHSYDFEYGFGRR